MGEITASLVMELRQRSGAGMMDCKKALIESGGNIDDAADWLRAHGLAKAAKKAERLAKEGLIKIHKVDERHGVMLVINCETDFVARNDEFRQMVADLAGFFATAQAGLQCLGAPAKAEHIEREIKGMAYKGHTVGEELTQAVAKIGENIQLGQIVIERSEQPGDFLQDYLHGNRVGVLVCLTTGKPETHQNPKFQELAKDLAMQVAAAMPRVPESVDSASLDSKVIEHEKAVLTEQAKAEGKPPEIAEKMVMGRLNKFYEEVCLLEQPFIKDDKAKVKDIIKAVASELNDTIKVARFHRFQLGE